MHFILTYKGQYLVVKMSENFNTMTYLLFGKKKTQTILSILKKKKKYNLTPNIKVTT